MPNIIYNIGECQITEKHSKFFGYSAPVQTEAEAEIVIAQMRSRHPQAGHHVYAYDIIEEKVGRYTRQSDDGEPHGTAGMPVMNLFVKLEIINFVCVISRIFGGILLGKGGLARAYAAAAKQSLENAGFGPLIIRHQYKISIPYPDWDRLKYTFKKNDIAIDAVDFATACETVLTVTEEQEKLFHKIIEDNGLNLKRSST